MSITEERAAALQEILADWRQADPAQVWDAFDFEDFNEMVGDLAALLAEVERLRVELAKTREITSEKVERMAKAMIAASPYRAFITEDEREWYLQDARAAFAALLQEEE